MRFSGDNEIALRMRSLIPRATAMVVNDSGRVSMSTAELHVRRILEFIERSYSQRVTLRVLARALDRQASYLGALFRRETGLSVRECLTQTRLDRASVLIREGVKIEAVSQLVGYRSKKNFYRQFKRRFAMTPFAYAAHTRDH
jgi:YesN/AraC family two-component response regulator